MESAAFAIRLDAEPVPLKRHWTHCLGSGHATLALRSDWQRQLARCHRELGVRHVRFHGLLCDDVGTLVTVQDHPLYSFHNADLIMDFLDATGMSPLVELSFMPTALASGDKTVFHYRGNVTPPKDPLGWTELISALIGHWLNRYGRERLLAWLFEIWNEPNLSAFWSGSRDDYFEFYERTAHAIKAVCPALRVGGPATARTEWLAEFNEFCERRGAPCDFVSTHYYPTDALGDAATDTLSQLAGSARSAMREQVERARAHAGGHPLHLTEWSITSNPRDPMHDEPIAAAYVAKAAMEMAERVDGSSWWTFSDIFEENYFPSEPFHGGFGLLTLHGIPKPSYRAFQLLGSLGQGVLAVEGGHATVDCWATLAGNRLTVLLVNLVLPRQPGGDAVVRLAIHGAPAARSVSVRRIDHEHANAKRAWQGMGAPGSLDGQQVVELEAASELHDEALAWSWQEGVLEMELEMPVNGVALVVCELESLQPSAAGAAALEGGEVHGAEALAETSGGDASSGSHGRADTALLIDLQRQSYSFFLKHTDGVSGLVRDRSMPGSPFCTAATGLGLACYPVAVERGLRARAEAARLALAALTTLLEAHQGPEPEATGYRGFYYHFLDATTLRRAWDCELSTVDSALLVAGALTAAHYFTADTPAERGVRDAASEMLLRTDWRWALAGGDTLSHGWHPTTGQLPHRWEGYSEALILYALALGSPAHAIEPDCYRAWTRTYPWKSTYGITHLYAGPLFVHQLSHCWIDFRGIRDAPMRDHRLDYFENSRRATIIQQHYARTNPLKFRGYGPECWGLTACEGPGPDSREVDGIGRSFLGYAARGAPFGPDDGTIAPWAVVASLPFAPEIVLPAVRHFDALGLRTSGPHGFLTTFNASYPGPEGGWRSSWHFGLNQGPIVLMVENHLSGLPWELMRGCRPVVDGLKRADFTGGWLDRA